MMLWFGGGISVTKGLIDFMETQCFVMYVYVHTVMLNTVAPCFVMLNTVIPWLCNAKHCDTMALYCNIVSL